MKLTIPLQQFKRSIILFISGAVCLLLAFVTYVGNPAQWIFNYKLDMRPNSLVFQLWRKPPIDVFIKIYIFNITNVEAFLNGEEKLKVEETGPYVYQEILENQNVTWHTNKTISYMPKRTIVFKREMSSGDPAVDMVSVPNIPMLGLSSTLHDAGFLVNFPWTRLVNMVDSKPILNITVHDYLWGYEDRLVHLANSVVPNFINFQKFGLLDRMYDEGNNVVFMNVGRNENMTEEDGRYLSIESYNYSPGMSQWGYTEPEGNETLPQNTICNRVKGCTEGELFPTHLDKHAVFRVFRKAFCRAIPIVFKEQLWLESGLEGYLYSVADDFLDPPDMNPDNKCFCKNPSKCLKKGLSDMTPCYYRIPAAMSLPHFLDADPSLLEDVEGLNPDPEKHRTRIILQPSIGIPMHVNSRIQINLVMYPTSYNPKIKVFNDLTVPLFWSDLGTTPTRTFLFIPPPRHTPGAKLVLQVFAILARDTTNYEKINRFLRILYLLNGLRLFATPCVTIFYIPTPPSDIIFLLKMILHVLPIGQTVLIWSLVVAGLVMAMLSVPALMWSINQQQEPLPVERRDSTDLRIPLNYGQYTTIRILPAIKKITSRTDLFS